MKVGFNFKGWYSDADRQIIYDFNTLVTGDMTLYAKWTKSDIDFINFNTSELAKAGVKWNVDTKTLDITEATGSAVISFDVTGVHDVIPKVVAAYDTQAKSIGGESVLNDIVKVGAVIDNKIAMEVKTPVQSLNVPLDIYVSISDASNPDEAEVITIKSRPNYYNTEYKPVMMKTTDGKTVFWAPLNVGATKMPESVPNTANTDITETCGQLFQWGRKFGLATTNNAQITSADTTGIRTSLGYPTGQAVLTNMSNWTNKFIYPSPQEPNTQGNWLLFEAGKDNPADAAMEDGAWYQKLWNSGTEKNPVKTEYDPCPEGWRVPTISEWKAIYAGNTNNWDDTKKLMSITGADAEGEQKLVLPAAGYRRGSTGISLKQGEGGYAWSSSVPSHRINASVMDFSGSLSTYSIDRASGRSVRCIQE